MWGWVVKLSVWYTYCTTVICKETRVWFCLIAVVKQEVIFKIADNRCNEITVWCQEGRQVSSVQWKTGTCSVCKELQHMFWNIWDRCWSLQLDGQCVWSLVNHNPDMSPWYHYWHFLCLVFNLLKLFPVSVNMLRKWFTSYLFIYKHLLKYWSVTAFCYCPFYIAANREFLMKRQLIFRYINAIFPPLYCLKFLFKLDNISRSYAIKQKVYFCMQCVLMFTVWIYWVNIISVNLMCSRDVWC